jgi:hypothetical protein
VSQPAGRQIFECVEGGLYTTFGFYILYFDANEKESPLQEKQIQPATTNAASSGEGTTTFGFGDHKGEAAHVRNKLTSC